jgi:hypothetical protein
MLFIRDVTAVPDEIERLKHCCDDRRDSNWVALPIEGCTLRSCLISSCGKRGDMYAVTEELPPLHLALSHHILWGSLSGIEQRFLALDDVSVALVVHPQLNTRVRLVEAKVNFWLENENPTTYLAVSQAGEPWEFGAAFDVRLGLEVI